MNQRLPISAFVIAVNEANRIGAVLERLKPLVDEIVVVDSGSTDGTQELAESFGARVIHNDWPGYGPQKRFAESQCRNDWLLNLDADEVLSDKLTAEMTRAFAGGPPKYAGYFLRIRDCDQDQRAPSWFAHTTRAVRLYDRRAGRYADSTVHDRVQFEAVEPKLGELRAPVLHYSTVSIEQAINKLNRYSSMQADEMKGKGKRPKMLGLRLVFEFPLAFFKSLILRGDVLRGSRGFVNAMTYAFSRFARIAKAWERAHGARDQRADPGASP